MDPVTSSIIVGVLISVVSGIIIGYLNNRWKKKAEKKAEEEAELEAIKKEIIALRRTVWRLGKTMLIMAKVLDDQSEKNHGDNPVLEEIANELLRENGDPES